MPIFKCSHTNCSKEYSSKYNLQRHFESSHIRTRRFRCHSCGKYLSSKQNLQEHSYTHSKQTPYVCSYPSCGKSFRQSSQLSNHKKIHQELLNLCRKQNEFVSLKLDSQKLGTVMQLDQGRKRCESFFIKEEHRDEEGKVFLPSLSGPQFSVTLPGFGNFNLD